MAEPVTTTDLDHLRGNPYAERSWVPRLVDAIDLRDRIIDRLDAGLIPDGADWLAEDGRAHPMAPDEAAYFEARRATGG